SGPDAAVVAFARHRDRPEIRLAVGAGGLPQNPARSPVERADRALFRHVRDGGVSAFAVAGRAVFDAAEFASRPHFGLPDQFSVARVERVKPAAFLTRADQPAAVCAFEEDRSGSEINVEVVTVGLVFARDRPDVARDRLPGPHLFA